MSQSYTRWVEMHYPEGFYAMSPAIGGEVSELGPYRTLKDAAEAGIHSFPEGVTFDLVKKDRAGKVMDKIPLSYEAFKTWKNKVRNSLPSQSP